MSSTNSFHSFERLVWSLVALNHRAQLTGNFSNTDVMGVAFGDDYPVQDITFREDTNKFAFFIEYADGADISGGHKRRSFLDSC